MNALEKQVVRSFRRLQDAADAVDDIREMCDAVCAERDSFADELVRMRLAFKQLVDSFAKPGASVDIRISGCEWCGEMWPKTEGQSREVTLEAAKFHLAQCKEHPLVKQLEQQRPVLAFVQQLINGGCEFGDGCPLELKNRNGVCVSCQARNALSTLSSKVPHGE